MHGLCADTPAGVVVVNTQPAHCDQEEQAGGGAGGGLSMVAWPAGWVNSQAQQQTVVDNLL